MNYLSTNPTYTLDQALAAEGTFANVAAFAAAFNPAGSGAGATFIQTLNLADADTGAIGGGTATSVVPDVVNFTNDPLTGFAEIWPTINSAATPLSMQIGANSGITMNVALVNVSTSVIGLGNVDVVNQASNAIDQFDSAINYVSSERSRLGALQNRMEHALTVANNSSENLTASESRIRDLDMAKEMIAFGRNTILSQAATAMLAQANQQPQSVLQLLKAG